MTMFIQIGNTIANPDHAEDHEEPPFIVADNLSPGPCFEGEVFHRGVYNYRNMSGMQWRYFLEETQLGKLFDKNHIVDGSRLHRIDLSFALEVENLYQEYVRKHALPPGYGDGKDGNLARFIWLGYWVSYAVDKYQTPAIFTG